MKKIERISTLIDKYLKNVIFIIAILVLFFISMQLIVFKNLWSDSYVVQVEANVAKNDGADLNTWHDELLKVDVIKLAIDSAVLVLNFSSVTLLKQTILSFKSVVQMISIVLFGLVAFHLVSQPTLEGERWNIKTLNLSFINAFYYWIRNGYLSFTQNFKSVVYLTIAFSPLLVALLSEIFKNSGAIPQIYNFTYLFPIAAVFINFGILYAYYQRFGIVEIQARFKPNQFNFDEPAVLDRKEYIGNVPKKVVPTNIIMNETELEKHYQVLLSHLENKKSYLDSSLTIAKLSEQLNISLHHLSYTINRKEDKNFNEFINSYRISLAMEKLKNPSYAFMSVEGIGADCGFSTKTTFYNAFKKITNQSPAEFRKESTEK